MELEVRVVAGIESCFVSLPVTLLQTLESTTASGYLPPVLALELRSGNNLWRLAWSGSASSNPFPNSIQIAKQYAECIGLLDRTVVQVKVVSNLPKATMVTIEPDTEDDWEVLELNAEHAEQAILKQVAIVYGAMRFPLWLHGQTIITFKVVSTFPLTPVGLVVLLSSASWMLSSAYDFPLPGHILIHGPSGSGKTLLATVAAKFAEESEDILAHIIFLSCSKLALEKPSAIRQALLSYVADALDHAPSVVVFDDLDSIVAASSESEASQPSSSSAVLAEYFADIMDEYEEKRRNTCGIGPVAFIACAQSLTNLPQKLTSSGRFDFHVKLSAPATTERGALLKHIIQKRSLQCSDDTLLDIASKCDGYDAYDLEILVDRSVHAATARFLSSDLAVGSQEKPVLFQDDFLRAMHEFVPVAMRDITKPAADGGRSGWEDVGGLNDIRNAIIEMIELPSKFPNIFAQAPLRMRSNVLLYGPPGCGKTHIVGAAAAACSLRFISVKGPELLNKYIGASEQAVRDIFSKAAAAAPCLLFFDEFDSIAPKRGHDNTGVTDRVVNQFLTELDGVEVLTGVFVFAATSRPDLLDAALLRPGRLDRLLFCDFPSQHERSEILSVLSRKLPLASDVDLDVVARLTEGFSGADLQALLSDAQLEAVHDLLDSENAGKPDKKPVISDALLKSIASKAKSSVSDAEKQRLYDIYSQFLDSKRSVAAQSRDAKGKRATLA